MCPSKIERPVALVILDGWGHLAETKGNAIASAHTPYYDRICSEHPWTVLGSSGELVGLGADAPGNAELGHMNIGAGRVVRSVHTNIREAVVSGSFFDNIVLAKAFSEVSARTGDVHLVGLISDADVHSSMDNLFALLRMAKRYTGVGNVYIHAILDGRDVPPRTADIYVEALEIKLADIGVGRIATLCGRFFAMDSTENWERTARAFTMMVHAEGERASDPVSAVRSSFLRGISDEFIAPIVIEDHSGEPVGKVKDGDLVVFFNHRADTMRQLVRSLAVPDQGLIVAASKPDISAVCLTEYDRAFGLPVAFEQKTEPNGLASVLAANGISNYRISETDRMPHVSKFINCGFTSQNPFERDVEVASSDASLREMEPEMRSFKIVDKMLNILKEDRNAFFVMNIPAPGLLAETGSLERTVEAVQYVDTCIGGIVGQMEEAGGVTMITSSHGNCESMFTESGEPDRFATMNPVPFHIIDPTANGIRLREGGSLKDVAPTVLGILGMTKPAEMSGEDLRNS